MANCPNCGGKTATAMTDVRCHKLAGGGSALACERRAKDRALAEVARLRAKLAGGCAMCDTLRETNRILDAVNRALRAKLAKVREACEPRPHTATCNVELGRVGCNCRARSRNAAKAEIAALLEEP